MRVLGDFLFEGVVWVSVGCSNLLTLLVFVFLGAGSLAAEDWDPIAPEDLAATECLADPGAEAEVLYKEQIYDQSDYDDPFESTHLRVKIYGESGVQAFRTHQIRYDSSYTIYGLMARVVKPNGDEIEVEKKDIFTRSERKKDKESETVTTFSIPHLEVGDIAEYKYRLDLDNDYFITKFFVMLQEKRSIRELDLIVRPYGYYDRFKWLSRRSPAQVEFDGSETFSVKLENLAAYPEEPYQSPTLDSQAWIYFFESSNSLQGEEYWLSQGKALFRQTERQVKVTRRVRAKAAELLKGKNSRDEKLQALYDFCRLELINSDYRRRGELSTAQKNQLEDDTWAGTVLKREYGHPGNITTLFCSLAMAAGFDARFAVVPHRSFMSFSMETEYRTLMMPHELVAIANGDDWEFYDPGRKYLEMRELNWRNEGVMALIADRRKLAMAVTQQNSSAYSKKVSRGEFELSVDGTLSGTVTLDFTGNLDYGLKTLLDGMSESEQIEYLKNRFEKNWPNGTLSEIEGFNMSDASAPVRISYRVVTPNYAEVIGNRIFVQPNAFKRYAEPWFVSERRVTELFFEYAYENTDIVDIKLPDGFKLEEASAPEPFEVKPLINYQPTLALKRSTNQLRYECKTDFMGGIYPVRAYHLVKAALDKRHRWDQHSVTIKRSPETEPTANADIELGEVERVVTGIFLKQ